MKMRNIILFISILILGQSHLFAAYKIDRLEPEFWWAGMKNPHLQLMVYGENISQLTPVVDYQGVAVLTVTKVENPNYLFVDLNISSDTKAGTFNIDFKEGTKTRATYQYKLLPRDNGSASREGFNTSDVLYLITPDRFINGDPGNDSKEALKEKVDRENPDGRHGGDIAGIMNNLDYISDLGFTAIWVNPVLENDQPEYSYHGYSTTDFYKVDSRFGSNGDYRKLGEVAKKKGIKFIMDMIVNHCGSEHWWMSDLPTSDWINSGGKFVQTNHRKSVLQDPHVAKIDQDLMVDGWFVETMPDLNQKNPLFATYLIQNTIWWIEYSHLAGIRMDTYPYPDMNFMSDWTCAVLNEYPNFNIVGEEWTTNPAIVAYWQKGKQNPNGYTSCLPSLMDFPLQAALTQSLTEEEKQYGSGFINLYEALGNDFLYADPNNLVTFPDNHDMSRFFTQVNEDFDLFKLGLIYTLTTRGIPQLYYGTEILMSNPGTDDHGVIRSDYPGGWQGDKVSAITEQGLTDQQKEAKAFVSRLANWRKTAEAIHDGELTHFAPEDGIYTFFRYTDSKKVMVVLSKNAEDQSLDMKRFSEIVGSSAEGREILTGKAIDLTADLKVPAMTGLVIELN